MESKVLAVLKYMFHGGFRRVSGALSLAYELISKSGIRHLVRVVLASEKRCRRCIAVDETKICVEYGPL